MIRLQVGGYLGDRTVQRAVDRAVARTGAGIGEPQHPDAVQEAVHALDPGGIPVRALCPRTQEHQEEPQRVGAVDGDVLVGCLHVPARLRHLATAEDDRALVAQPKRRLVEPELAQVAQGLAHETHVEQVQDRVLDPPGVLMHRQPLAAQILVHERGGELWVQVAIHVPGRVDECVHRVNVPARGATAFRTRGVDEGRDVRQRRASATGELDVARKRDRQVLVAHRDRPVGIAIHHRDGRSPVALP